MASTGWLSPTQVTQFASAAGQTNWANIDNIKAQDNVIATSTPDNGSAGSTRLVGYNLQPNLPVGSKVIGLQVRVVVYSGSTVYAAEQPSVLLALTADTGSTTSSSFYTFSIGSAENSTTDYGSATSVSGWGTLSGRSLDAQHLSSSSFGFILRQAGATLSGSPSPARIDAVQVNVFYDLPDASYVNTGTGAQNYSMTYGGIATAGPTVATVATNEAGLFTQWVNPGNATTSNDARATLTFPGSNGTTVTDYGYLNTTARGFNIPTGATILGIQVGVEHVRSGGSTGEVRLNTVQLMKAGVRVGQNKGNTSNVSTLESTTMFGGNSDLWQTTWTAEDLNDTNFGVSVRPIASSAATNRVYQVDSVPVTVTYVVPAQNNNPSLVLQPNTATGTQTYAVKQSTSSSYQNANMGSQDYALGQRTPLTVSNTGTGAQNYTLITAAGFGYNQGATGTQTYTAQSQIPAGYSNTGSGSQSYQSMSIVNLEQPQNRSAATIAKGTIAFSPTGKFGQSMSSGQYEASVNPYPPVGRPHSLEAWVKTTDTKLSAAAGQAAGTWIGQDVNGFARGTWNATNAASDINLIATVKINDGQWHHVLMTINPNAGVDQGARLYVDGILVKSDTRIGSGGNRSNLFGVKTLGSFTSGTNQYSITWNGEVDEIAVWDHVKQTNNFAVPTAPYPDNSPGLLAIYHLEGSGFDSRRQPNTSTGVQNYSATYGVKAAYANTGVGSQSYNLNTMTGFGYNQGAQGVQNYALTATTEFANYTNLGTGTQNYVLRQAVSLAYANTNTGSQSYTLTQAASTLPIEYVNSRANRPVPAPELTGSPAIRNSWDFSDLSSLELDGSSRISSAKSVEGGSLALTPTAPVNAPTRVLRPNRRYAAEFAKGAGTAATAQYLIGKETQAVGGTTVVLFESLTKNSPMQSFDRSRGSAGNFQNREGLYHNSDANIFSARRGNSAGSSGDASSSQAQNTLNELHVAVLVFDPDATTHRLYVDGNPPAENSVGRPVGIDTVSMGCRVGGNNPSAFYNGYIYRVIDYPVALNQQQIDEVNAWARANYFNTSDDQSYTITYGLDQPLVGFENSGVGSQNYALSLMQPEDLPGNDGLPGRGQGPGRGQQYSNAPVKKKIVKVVQEVIEEIAEPQLSEEDKLLEELVKLREAEALAAREQARIDAELEAMRIAAEELERIRLEALEEEAALRIILDMAMQVQESKRLRIRIAQIR